MLLRLISLTVFLLFFINGATAQSSLLAESKEEVLEATTLHVVSDGEDGIFFTDPESKVCFIDFDQIDGYAKQLVVKKGDEDVLVDEDVWDLPENTIYELDFEEYTSGNYQIELHTYSTVIKKELNVR